MNEATRSNRVWRNLRFSVRTIWMLFLAISLMANLALGITNFILQPIWRAAAVASTATAIRAKAEVQERKAVAKSKAKEQAKARAQRATAVATAIAATKVQSKAETKLAVANARAYEKAKGRIRRVSVAVPILGLAIAGGFEYADFTEWQKDHPDGDFQEYANETLEISQDM